jgi:hypothetical protein
VLRVVADLRGSALQMCLPSAYGARWAVPLPEHTQSHGSTRVARLLGFSTPRNGGVNNTQHILRETDMNKSTQKVIDTLQQHMAENTLVWHNPCVMATLAKRVGGK